MEIKVLTIKESVFGANDENAKKNQSRLDSHNVLAINIMSSPGSGKTSLLLQTIKRLKDKLKISVIEGDVASSLDAETIHKQGTAVVQINTAGGCHLDANMIKSAMDNLPLDDTDLLFVENVGNLICPAEFALGEHKKAILLSVPEGDDKPHKYPLMFSEADVILLNKNDLLPYVDFNVEAFYEVAKGLNPDVTIIPISCKTGEGLEDWISWLELQFKEVKARPGASPS